MSRPEGWSRGKMIRRVISFFHHGATVNLGIGLPTLVAEMAPPELDLVIHAENGVLGVAGRPTRDTVSPTLINAGKETISIRQGASFFDSALSFGMVRGGHIDFCVLGGMEVDMAGSLANWMVPGQKVTGMGGAMDLVHGAKQVIVVMTHFAKSGSAKLLEKCSLPLTGVGVVDSVVTELGVFRPRKTHFEVVELAEGIRPAALGLPESLLRIAAPAH
jgi:3-oxoacid CoA-transferase subunit B